jgi:hypothetical protein
VYGHGSRIDAGVLKMVCGFLMRCLPILFLGEEENDGQLYGNRRRVLAVEEGWPGLAPFRSSPSTPSKGLSQPGRENCGVPKGLTGSR